MAGDLASHGAELCLNEMPYGRFLEIEATADLMPAIIRTLELAWSQRIRASYLEMFAALKQKAPLAFDDVTFDNFAENFSFAPYRHLFEAGDSNTATKPIA